MNYWLDCISRDSRNDENVSDSFGNKRTDRLCAVVEFVLDSTETAYIMLISVYPFEGWRVT